jgi:hypothetical protein
MPGVIGADSDRRPRQDAVAKSEWVLSVTSMRDGREHLVPDEAMTAAGMGNYLALCGHRVGAAVLTCPPGPPCLACTAVRRVAIPEQTRHRTAGLWRWAGLIARLRGQRPTASVLLPAAAHRAGSR